MSDNKRTEYHAGLDERIARSVPPYVYYCRKSTKTVKFYNPMDLEDAEKSMFILAVFERARYDAMGASVQVLEVLKAWVGEEGYNVLLKEEKNSLNKLSVIFQDAFTHFERDFGTEGESSASTS